MLGIVTLSLLGIVGILSGVSILKQGFNANAEAFAEAYTLPSPFFSGIFLLILGLVSLGAGVSMLF